MAHLVVGLDLAQVLHAEVGGPRALRRLLQHQRLRGEGFCWGGSSRNKEPRGRSSPQPGHGTAMQMGQPMGQMARPHRCHPGIGGTHTTAWEGSGVQKGPDPQPGVTPGSSARENIPRPPAGPPGFDPRASDLPGDPGAVSGGSWGARGERHGPAVWGTWMRRMTAWCILHMSASDGLSMKISTAWMGPAGLRSFMATWGEKQILAGHSSARGGGGSGTPQAIGLGLQQRAGPQAAAAIPPVPALCTPLICSPDLHKQTQQQPGMLPALLRASETFLSPSEGCSPRSGACWAPAEPLGAP